MRRYIIRILGGWAFWLALVAIYFGFRGSTHLALRPLRPLAHIVMLMESVATWPVAGLGTLLLDWQTGPQPEPWVLGKPFNVAVGLGIYGVLGLLVGALCSRWRKSRDTRVDR